MTINIKYNNVTGFLPPFNSVAQELFGSLDEAKSSLPKNVDTVVFVDGKVGSYRILAGTENEEVVYPAKEGVVYYYGGAANPAVSAFDATSYEDSGDMKYGSTGNKKPHIVYMPINNAITTVEYGFYKDNGLTIPEEPSDPAIEYEVLAANNTTAGGTTFALKNVTAGGNSTFIPIIDFELGKKYIFDWSQASSYPFRFSTISNGTNNGGLQFTRGVTVDEVNHTTSIIVDQNFPERLFYYSHGSSIDMGSRIDISLTA